MPDDLKKILSLKQQADLLNLDSRRRYQAIRRLRGLCIGCGQEKSEGKGLGKNCLERQRVRMQKNSPAKKRGK